MSALTANGLVELFEAKGYTAPTRFYSPAFEFTDTIKAGLQRVQQEFAGQTGAGAFSLSSYPVWEQQGKPHVSSYFSCSYENEKFSIRLLDLSYNNGTYKGELSRQLIKEPAPEDIPDRQHMGNTLEDLTAGGNKVKESERNIKRLKL